MGYRRTFMEDVRRQLAVETESDAVGRMRFFGAGLSIAFGAIGLFGFLSMARGVVSWAAAPGFLVLLAGGVLGVGAQVKKDVKPSRRLGLWAAICTIVGLVEVLLVAWLS